MPVEDKAEFLKEVVFAESFRQLRTDLQFISKENSSSTVLVTSMVEGEGKSTLVANLSSIFQLAGFKSIVIDLDLRNPTLHRYFDIEYNGGMSRYLSGKDTIADIVFSTAYPNLDIIPAGPITTNPSELLLSSRLNILLEKLKKEYDYIFIDSAPLGGISDTLNIMKLVDVNLFVLRKDYAKKSFLKRLEKMILKYDLKNIKLIMNANSKLKKIDSSYLE
jgi:capsular exopolysaccharide synthesis family protein